MLKVLLSSNQPSIKRRQKARVTGIST